MADHVDLAELEMAFAKDPSSDAFLALSQAYLDQGRFMEAMVVCKKGIRSQPDSLEGRLLLARVYAEQGKVPKAIDEVKALLERDHEVAEAHFFLGQLHERSGRFEEAIDAFKEALVLDRHHKGVKDALHAKGIEFDPGPTPEEIEAQRLAEEQARADEEARKQAEAQAAAAAEAANVISQTPMPANGNGIGQMPHTPATGSSTPPSGEGFAAPPTTGGFQPPGHSGSFAQVGYFGGYDPLAQQAERSNKKWGLGFTFGLFAILLFVVGGLILFLNSNKEKQEEIIRIDKEAKPFFASQTTFGLKKAADLYGKILTIDDEHEMASARRAFAYQLLRFERDIRVEKEASEALKLAEKHAPEHPLTVASKALRLTRTGKADDALNAVAAFRERIGEREPPDAVVVSEAKALLAKGQLGKLKPLVKKLSASDKPGPLAFAGKTWRRLGEDLNSAVALDKALKYEPDHDPARAQRALLLLETKDLGRIDVVLRDVTHLLDLGKEGVGTRQRGYAKLCRAEFGRLLEKEDQAKTDFQQAKDILGKEAEMYFYEARWAFAKEEDAAGIEALEKSLEVDPHRIRPWQSLITRAGSKKKTRAKAEEAYKKATKIFGDHPLLVEARVELLGRQRKLDEANRYLQGLAKTADSPTVQRELGRVLLAKKDYEAAVTQLNKAAKMADKADKNTKASTYTLLGRARAATDDHEKAIEAYTEAVKSAGSYAPAYFYLGRSLKRSGKEGAAEEAFGRASKLDPTSKIGKAAKKAMNALKE